MDQKMWFTHTMGYYQVLKRNEVLIHLQHGWTLKTLCLEKASNKRPKVLWFHLHEMSRRGTSVETESRLVIAYSWAWGEGWLQMVMEFLFGEREKCPKFICIYTHTHTFSQHYENAKDLWIVLFERVSYIVYKVYLNEPVF